jgi:taurine dioxygenase
VIEFKPMTRHIGAEVTGVDLAKPLNEEQVATLRQALLDHLVLIFREQQHIGDDEQVALAGKFGVIDSTNPVLVLDQTDPTDEGPDQWHADGTFWTKPTMGALLRATILPKVGGDTLWANMYLAYESLASSTQRLCDELYAEHDQTMTTTKLIAKGHRLDLRARQEEIPPRIHPVVYVHPETGRKALYVNRAHVSRLVGLSQRENEALLPLLFDTVRDPKFQVRLTWRAGTLALWDNRSTQHYAVPDYTERRTMHRVALHVSPEIDDGVPIGPGGVTGADAPAESPAARYL